jgi:hypothetical protein
MGRTSEMYLNITEKVIDELQLDDSYDTLVHVEEWIMDQNYSPDELQDITFISNKFRETLCPQCFSLFGKDCSCFSWERL